MKKADVQLEDDLDKRYERLAQQCGRTKAYYMHEALASSIDYLEYECGLLKQLEDYEAGRLKTYSIDEVDEELGLNR